MRKRSFYNPKSDLRSFKNFVSLACFGALSLISFCNPSSAQTIRRETLLNNNWQTIASETNKNAYDGFEAANYKTKNWINVDVPHNWDTYGGYRRLKHGNLHGYACYRKTFTANVTPGKRYFLWFEGVGSYATVWLNGKQVGYHAGGRTSFTLDITDALQSGKTNLLAVRADHPAFIKDLPWVCGGCSDEGGFSEGSQPMGIFRPVHLIVTDAVRIEPFGVHIWNDTTVTTRSATLNLETEVKNYDSHPANVIVLSKLVDAKGKVVIQGTAQGKLSAGQTQTLKQVLPYIKNVRLWSLEDPYLYKMVSQVSVNGKVVDETTTPYGIRWISWAIGRNNGDNRFYLNGKPVFINGIAEYEHLMGKSQAFSPQEIKAQVAQVRAAGFNAFRDAHQPHNLEFQKYWDTKGLLWWPQYSAHIWFDTKEFRDNYKALLRDWIKERRNSPSVILWGLENESKLPEDFAKECSAIIRSMDPTASSQRKITTCNGGKGTDWDVPQNWTGTYGGDPQTYAQDLQKQILVGEYGAWRSLDLHTEGPFVQNGPYSEERYNQLLETKIRLAESAKDKVAGHFQWLLYSHENPGRVQGGEGERELDRVGPVNYKGLFTIWGEPTDGFYLYRSNYASKLTDPMVYIVSHTWPNRWLKPGVKDSISVYSNCDEVELFNDVNGASLGKKANRGKGTHFQWDKVNIRYNVLYAVGYVNGKAVAKDYVVLNHLPDAPHLASLDSTKAALIKPVTGQSYVYRVNCGGPDIKDQYGNTWLADQHKSSANYWGSTSWTDDYNGTPAFFASQQRNFGAGNQLFNTFRYGMDKLKYTFKLANGDYQVELYFTEPWYGVSGMNCAGWRVFDVAVNNKTVIKNLDIWKEAGYNSVLKKTITAHVVNGQLQISFPNVEAGEAIISAIAISTKNKIITGPMVSKTITIADNKASVQSWLDIGNEVYTDSKVKFSKLPSVLYGAEWVKSSQQQSVKSLTTDTVCDVYIAMNVKAEARPQWLKDYVVTGLSLQTDENGGENFAIFRKRYPAKAEVGLADGKYIVAVLPATSLEPATDLKKTVSYKAADAKPGAGAVQDTLSGKTVVRFTQAAGSVLTFDITPGVADKYELRVRYNNNTTKTFTAKAELHAEDGTLMNRETLTFKPLQKGKSGSAITSSGTSINAGNYKLIITGVDAEGLMISGLEMQ